MTHDSNMRELGIIKEFDDGSRVSSTGQQNDVSRVECASNGIQGNNCYLWWRTNPLTVYYNIVCVCVCVCVCRWKYCNTVRTSVTCHVIQ